MNELAIGRPGQQRSGYGISLFCSCGVVWLLFFMTVSRVRTIEPIFLWVATQSLIAEALLGTATKAAYTLFFIAVYLAVMIVGWVVVERVSSDPAHVWRRAALTSVGMLVVYIVVATVLFQTGIVHE